MGDSIMDNANKLDMNKLSALLYKKGFSVSKSYDTYSGRRRTFLDAWREDDTHKFRFRDWTVDIELTPKSQFYSKIMIVPTLSYDIVIARRLVEECWNANEPA